MVTHPTCPPSFVRTRPQLFEISCTQTNRQTERGENITFFTFGGGSKSVHQISALLELLCSTANAVIVKWKRLCSTTAQLQSGRPHKPTERDSRVLKRIARKNRLSSVASHTTEFQTDSGSNVSTSAVSQELREMGFHGQAAARKPKITMRNAKLRLWKAFPEEWRLL